MASCYGGGDGEIGALDGRLRVAECCPYFPLTTEITLPDNSTAMVQLSIFLDESEMLQGLQLMNNEIEVGRSWPFDELFPDLLSYRKYFLSHAAFAVTFCDKEKFGTDLLGCFYIKPNFPGRCSHVCNGGFITNVSFRGMGLGKFMGGAFKKLAKDLGYKSSLFNLVFANNTASVKLWRSLGFKELATIPKAASLKGCDELVDAIQMSCHFYEHD